MQMRKVEAGVYEDPSGQYRVERVDSLGEGWSYARQQWVETTTSVWTVTRRDHPGIPSSMGGEWTEIAERKTKRECVHYLIRLLERLEREAADADPVR